MIMLNFDHDSLKSIVLCVFVFIPVLWYSHVRLTQLRSVTLIQTPVPYRPHTNIADDAKDLLKTT